MFRTVSILTGAATAAAAALFAFPNTASAIYIGSEPCSADWGMSSIREADGTVNMSYDFDVSAGPNCTDTTGSLIINGSTVCTVTIVVNGESKHCTRDNYKFRPTSDIIAVLHPSGTQQVLASFDTPPPTKSTPPSRTNTTPSGGTKAHRTSPAPKPGSTHTQAKTVTSASSSPARTGDTAPRRTLRTSGHKAAAPTLTGHRTHTVTKARHSTAKTRPTSATPARVTASTTSFRTEPVSPAAPASTTTAATSTVRTGDNNLTWWILLFVLLAVVGAGAYTYRYLRRAPRDS